MSADSAARSIEETLLFLELQLRELREAQTNSASEFEGLRRQVHELVKSDDERAHSIRETNARFTPLKGVPEGLRELGEDAEHIRTSISTTRAELENALRILQSEAGSDRDNRATTVKRIAEIAGALSSIASEMAQLQAQVSNVAQVTQSLIERQREAEAKVEQFGLRLDRTLEVHQDLEERIKEFALADQEARFEVVFERLQLIGEMVKRNEELVREATAEQSVRQEVLQEFSAWRDQHNRLETRIGPLEESADNVLSQIDRLQGEISLVEGRHSGLSERVASIRRDIAEVTDQVREEFDKYNQMTEKQRRKQLQVLEQELREMKFHAFRPPEEP